MRNGEEGGGRVRMGEERGGGGRSGEEACGGAWRGEEGRGGEEGAMVEMNSPLARPLPPLPHRPGGGWGGAEGGALLFPQPCPSHELAGTASATQKQRSS